MPPLVDPEEGEPAGPIFYRVYSNDGHGGPIDYATPVAEVSDATWTSGPLDAASSYRFGVRVYDSRSGLEESNIDASTALVLDALARDATRTPPAPVGLRAVPLAGGAVRLEWSCPAASAARSPSQFNVYMNPGAIASYASPTATTPASNSRNGVYSIELTGLADGVAYAAVVRAANSSGEEPNTAAVQFTADSTAPAPIDALISAATSRSGV
ncbi:hypothetical protein [Paludisphaera rhizosphaerae]|uniref:hypothetical protein n=1 Tax=Paludisphaera rhizosphaerae TaxID=2711216 RepID=UPI0013EE1A3F|nr:hypothetical protein [Paludisphaera rhizosphaerae]